MIEEEVTKRLTDGKVNLTLYAEKSDMYKYVGYNGTVSVEGVLQNRNGLFGDVDTLKAT